MGRSRSRHLSGEDGREESNKADLSLSAVLSNFSLVIFHPYGGGQFKRDSGKLVEEMLSNMTGKIDTAFIPQGQQYLAGTRIQHLKAFWKSSWNFIIWMNELWLHCMLLVSYIQQCFIHLSQFWQIRFESYWLHCSKCRILVPLRYMSWYPSICNRHPPSPDVGQHMHAWKTPHQVLVPVSGFTGL